MILSIGGIIDIAIDVISKKTNGLH
ncbi:MAG: hypothetical protein RIT38_1241, partial [Bacteroidota bacterium]